MGHQTQVKHLLSLTPTKKEVSSVEENWEEELRMFDKIHISVVEDLCVKEINECVDCMECWPDRD